MPSNDMDVIKAIKELGFILNFNEKNQNAVKERELETTEVIDVHKQSPKKMALKELQTEWEKDPTERQCLNVLSLEISGTK